MKQAMNYIISGATTLLLALLLSASCLAMDDFPDEVEIDSLTNLFDGVVFDHAMHVDATEDCSVCHHHTTGTGNLNPQCAKCHDGQEDGETVSCQGCHAVDQGAGGGSSEQPGDYFYHDDKPTLKAAYHLNCIGCHRQVDGPTGCEDCHAKNENGQRYYHSGDYAPKPSGHKAGH